MTFGIETTEDDGAADDDDAGCTMVRLDVDESERRLFGRRYLSGVALTGDVAPEEGIEKSWPGARGIAVEWGLAVPDTTRAFSTTVESSFEPDLWPWEETSEDEVEDVVDIEAAAG